MLSKKIKIKIIKFNLIYKYIIIIFILFLFKYFINNINKLPYDYYNNSKYNNVIKKNIFN